MTEMVGVLFSVGGVSPEKDIQGFFDYLTESKFYLHVGEPSFKEHTNNVVKISTNFIEVCYGPTEVVCTELYNVTVLKVFRED